jgi:hypothetical protein
MSAAIIDAPELTPVERNALLVLMAENRPLREKADLRIRFGIAMTRKHRESLRKLGLIGTTRGPFTHSLTRRGWDWANAQTQSERPKGASGQGALYAVLSAVGRYADRDGITLGQIFQAPDGPPRASQAAEGKAAAAQDTALLPSGRTQEQMLQDAEFAEVDEALALLLQDQPVVDRALSRLDKKAGPALQNEVEAVRNAVGLILQWGRRAAARRSIVTVAGQGDEVSFDPLLYETDEHTKTGSRVLVRRTPIVRRTGSGEFVISRGRASAVI